MRYFSIGYVIQDQNYGHNDDWAPKQDEHYFKYLYFKEMPTMNDIHLELRKHHYGYPNITSITEWSGDDWIKLTSHETIVFEIGK